MKYSKERSSDPEQLKRAYADLGLKEIPGKRHNPRVIDMFALSGHAWVKDDETAWCAAAIGAWLKEAGMKGTGSLAARSYMKWGKKTNKPRRGDIVVFRRGNSTWMGHVALYLGQTATHVEVIGGNQRNRVSTAQYPKSKLLGFRRQSTVGNSKVIKAAAIGGTGAALGLGEQLASMAGYVDYLPSVLAATEGIDINWVLIGSLAVAVGLAGFIIWDRYVKVKEGM